MSSNNIISYKRETEEAPDVEFFFHNGVEFSEIKPKGGDDCTTRIDKYFSLREIDSAADLAVVGRIDNIEIYESPPSFKKSSTKHKKPSTTEPSKLVINLIGRIYEN